MLTTDMQRGGAMPKLVRLYILSSLIGLCLAVVFSLLLLWGNVGNLRHLVLTVPGGWVAGAMLVAANTIVFSGVQFGIAVMRLADDGRGGPTGGLRTGLLLAVTAINAVGRDRRAAPGVGARCRL